jgi:uncharacterized repeat protein (TIGR03803 family)
MRKFRFGVIACIVTVICVVTADAQTFTILHTFEGVKGGKDGKYPAGALIWGPGGILYGTTQAGGGVANAGTVFQVSPSGQESVLYSFRAAPDGKMPQAAVTLGPDGTLYGTTNEGGSAGLGTVFKLVPVNGTYKETIVYSFQGGTDGANPSSSGVVLDGAGNLYGTTSYGGGTGCSGLGCGTVFKIDPTGQESILYAFGPVPDGENPNAGLIEDSAGNLYGTTVNGGTSNKGTVFMLNASGGETILHSFAGSPDGWAPWAGLFRDAAGNLFGTTAGGGDKSTGCFGQGCGTVFEITSAGEEEVLYSFFNWRDEAYPYGGVVEDKAGNLYGTTLSGAAGSGYACVYYGKCGTVFMLSPKGDLTTLYRFTNDGDGAEPEDSLIFDASGNLYGTTRGDARTGSYGNVFELTP